MKNHFKKKVIPLALDMMGALKAWTTPCDDTIIKIWNIVFGADYPIDEGDNECYRFVVAKTLVSTFSFLFSWVSWPHLESSINSVGAALSLVDT